MVAALEVVMTRISKLPIHWLGSGAHKKVFTTACGLRLTKYHLRHVSDVTAVNCKRCEKTNTFRREVSNAA